MGRSPEKKLVIFDHQDGQNAFILGRNKASWRNNVTSTHHYCQNDFLVGLFLEISYRRTGGTGGREESAGRTNLKQTNIKTGEGGREY